jgi:hypothetical protein
MLWRKAGKILIDVGPIGSIDSRHAHKPGIIAKDGVLYHFYCAVAPARDKHQGEIVHDEVRGIALATNEAEQTKQNKSIQAMPEGAPD